MLTNRIRVSNAWRSAPHIQLAMERGPIRLSITLVRLGLLFAAGTMPVLSIALYVFGVLKMTYAAIFMVVPLTVVAAILILLGSPESVWALRGIAAGFVAVAAYDSVRMPLVFTHVWPDFIPRMGGWVIGSDHPSILVGYTWRLLGDGGGIGMAFFVFSGAALTLRPKLVTRAPTAYSIGYGIFIWTGLMITVVVPADGPELLFRLTPVSFGLSLLGHLIYGTVLGLYLRRALNKDRAAADRVAHLPQAREPIDGATPGAPVILGQATPTQS